MIEREYHFPKRFAPLPPGYRVWQLDSGHFIWTHSENDYRDGELDYERESVINVDRWAIRRGAFEDVAIRAQEEDGT